MLAPLERRLARVTRAGDIGAYRLLSCTDPGGPLPHPGQFYMLAAEQRWGGGEDERPFLPRALSFLRAAPGTLSFLLEDVGPGTHRLAELEPGDGLWLLGPLGVGFAAPRQRRWALLVGGGIGIAPLAGWQDALGAANVSALLGFRDARCAQAASLLAAPIVTTDDGAVGHHGPVTELLIDALDDHPHSEIYACGPPAMLEAVRALCAQRTVPAQLALEAGMACGFGACFGCVVPTRCGLIRLCVEGPVLDADELEGVA